MEHDLVTFWYMVKLMVCVMNVRLYGPHNWILRDMLMVEFVMYVVVDETCACLLCEKLMVIFGLYFLKDMSRIHMHGLTQRDTLAFCTNHMGVTLCGPWLKKPEDIVDFPQFPKANQQSLLCQSLTKDVWNKLGHLSDAQGVSFKTCILSGCQNVDSGIGCYAGSHDSYRTFAPLFDQVI